MINHLRENHSITKSSRNTLPLSYNISHQQFFVSSGEYVEVDAPEPEKMDLDSDPISAFMGNTGNKTYIEVTS